MIDVVGYCPYSTYDVVVLYQNTEELLKFA
jgi:hypothetical protein